MGDPNIAISLTLKNEGGYVNSPEDPGGATKYGVTQRDMPNINIVDITPEQATQYYLTQGTPPFWNPLYADINDQFLTNKIFDLGVLFGVETAVKILQGSLGISPADGLFGPHTLQVLNAANPVMALGSFKTALCAHAILIGHNEPMFTTGWLRRINS